MANIINYISSNGVFIIATHKETNQQTLGILEQLDLNTNYAKEKNYIPNRKFYYLHLINNKGDRKTFEFYRDNYVWDEISYW